MASEIWQFLIAILGFFVVAVVWLFVVYLPGRTLEWWEDRRPSRGGGRAASPKSSGGPLEPGP